MRKQGSARFHEILKELGELHDKKQVDYGRPEDPFANVRASEGFGVPGWVGCMIRANDKMVRIQKAAQGGQLANEALEDSLRDLAVYAVIGLCLFEEHRDSREWKEADPALVGGVAGVTVDPVLSREVDEAFDRITDLTAEWLGGSPHPDVVVGTLTNVRE